MDIVLTQQKPSYEDFVATAWAIWNARNSYIFREKIIPPEISYASPKDIRSRFHEANPQHPGNLSKEKHKQRWIPPDYGIYKVNVDEACDISKRKARLWIVVRNWEGKFIAGYAERLPGGSSATVVEALAILNGMKLACDLNLNRWVVVSDVQNVVSAIDRKEEDYIFICNIVMKCNHIPKNNPRGGCDYENRAGNYVAHNFAKFVLGMKGKLLWNDVCPE